MNDSLHETIDVEVEERRHRGETLVANTVREIRELVKNDLAIDGELKIVAFVDGLLVAAVGVGSLTCAPSGDRALSFRSGDRQLCEVDLPYARGTLRTVCARLATLCRNRTGRDVSPYGGEAEFTVSWGTPDLVPRPQEVGLEYKVRFVNTPSQHEFTIDARAL